MSRLWPERLVAIVLPNACKIYRAGGKEIGQRLPDASSAFDVCAELDSLIHEHVRRGRASLELIVSDSLARLAPLPWQDSLHNDEQYRAYARACFAQAGFELDDDWLLHAAYRHFRGMGLGYALPRALVSDVRDSLLKRQVQLRSIMPLSAHAYWRSTSGSRGKRTVLVLGERSRLSALLFEGHTCAGIEVQPMGASLSDAARRLSHAVEAVFPLASRAHFWSLGATSEEAEFIKTQFAVSGFQTLTGLGWS